MAKPEERLKARKLRRKGKSILVIAKDLGVSKGIVSLWCSDIVLTAVQEKQLRQNSTDGGLKGRMLGAEANRNKKIAAIKKALAEADELVGKVTQRDLLMLGTALYWAEGAKTGGRFVFINSDPALIKLALRFCTEILKVAISDIRIQIQINEIHKPRIKKIMRFWSEFLTIPLSQFGSPYYVKVVPKKRYENHDTYYGIVRLRVVKGSYLLYKTQGLIETIKRRGSSVG